MPLSKTGLSTRLKTEIEAKFGSAPFPVDLKKFTDAMANAIVDEIVANITITLSSNDIPIAPGSFVAGVVPVTGLGLQTPVTLNNKVT